MPRIDSTIAVVASRRARRRSNHLATTPNTHATTSTSISAVAVAQTGTANSIPPIVPTQLYSPEPRSARLRATETSNSDGVAAVDAAEVADLDVALVVDGGVEGAVAVGVGDGDVGEAVGVGVGFDDVDLAVGVGVVGDGVGLAVAVGVEDGVGGAVTVDVGECGVDGSVAVGTEITPNFDSLLVKMTCRGVNFEQAVQRAQRALNEFHVSGVATNIGFLRALLREPDFTQTRVDTGFINAHPHLLKAPPAVDESGRILEYIAETTVNKPNGERPTALRPFDKLPELDSSEPLPRGSRDDLLEFGPQKWAEKIRKQHALMVTDTTFRDAHQSLLATRVRSTALVSAAEAVARMTPNLFSVEAWGGATYDVAMRFLHEDPWVRLDMLREAMPNQNIQMLLRGRNTVGYTPYPDSVCRGFVQEAAKSGVDVFRIFDALNDVSQMRPAIDAVLETNTTVAEVAMAYSGDLSSPKENLYTLDYYLKLAEQIVESGAHILAIKDMAGLLRPEAASKLVMALRKEFDLPVHVHTHDTAGGQIATYFAAARAGRGTLRPEPNRCDRSACTSRDTMGR